MSSSKLSLNTKVFSNEKLDANSFFDLMYEYNIAILYGE
jgi:hypothetical protein